MLGPTVRTAVGWGTNAPPLDQLRLSTARPLAVSPWLRMTAVYIVGRLADPQTYPGDLVTIARGQLDIADRVELGATQLLQLGGRGAPGFSLVDFVLEHLRRRDASASASDSSNRRVGLDLAVRIAGLGGARIVYQTMFEDLREQQASAILHDADHLVGIATRWLTVEWRKTGERSYEHSPRVTGFKLRVRLGVRARIAVTDHLEIDPEAAIEDVEREAFVPGARRINTLLRAALVWRPSE